jgi:uncharacterized protein DUF4410
MKVVNRSLILFVALAILAGCASTKITQQQQNVSGRIPRPNQIWVYSFAAAPSEVPADSSIGGQLSPSRVPLTDEQIAAGRDLGTLIARNLVVDIQAMGLPAIRGIRGGTPPQVGDAVIRGYIVSVEGGSTVKRFVIGFGAGTSEMDTVVEGYIMTTQGLRKLGSGTLSSSGSKTPGMIVPAAVAIASGSPVGLIVVGGAKIYGEASGRNSLEGRAKATADEIAEQLKIRFQDRGWIS